MPRKTPKLRVPRHPLLGMERNRQVARGGGRAALKVGHGVLWHAIRAWWCPREFVTAKDVDGIIVRTDQVRALIAAEARFEAHKTGTSYPPSRILATLVAGAPRKLINMRKSAEEIKD